jgi:hypothetical protein
MGERREPHRQLIPASPNLTPRAAPQWRAGPAFASPGERCDKPETTGSAAGHGQ